MPWKKVVPGVRANSTVLAEHLMRATPSILVVLAVAAFAITRASSLAAQARGGGRPPADSGSVGAQALPCPDCGGGDVTPPLIWLNSPYGEVTSQYPFIEIQWCDRVSLNASSRSITVNRVNMTSSFNYVTPVDPECVAGKVSQSSTVALNVGANTIAAYICDNAGNCTTQSFTVNRVTPGAPAVATRNFNADNQDRSLCLTVGAGQAAGLACGDLFVTHAMPAYRTMGRDRALTLFYSSHEAAPRPVVAVAATQSGTTQTPNSVYAELRINGVVRASATYGSWGGGTTRQIVLAYDASGDPSGLYAYTLLVRNQYTGSTYDATVSGTLMVVNRSGSEFGAGWWVAGLEQLVLGQSGGAILWLGGDGSAAVYNPVTTNVWARAAGAYRDTLVYANSVYTRTLRHGIQVKFDATGRHIQTVNRVGNVTTFTWTGSPLRLTSIQVPPGGSGTTYTIAWEAGTNLIDAVTDPAGRVLNATTTAGNLVQLLDPDLVAVNFEYDAARRLTRRIGRRGYGTVYSNVNGLHATRVRVPLNPAAGDTATTDLEWWDEKGLAVGAVGVTLMALDTSLSYTKLYGPRPSVADDATFWVDRWGAPTRIVGAVSDETLLARDGTTGLVTRVRSANGQVVSASYDARGNVRSSTDSSTVLGGRYATTRYEWDPTWDAVTRMVPPELDSTVLAYDPVTGNRLWQQDARGTASRVNFTYYASGPATGLPASVQTPLTPAASIAYDGLGNLSTSTSPRGITTRYFRDAMGRDTLVVSPIDSAATKFQRQRTTYDPMNRVLTQVSAGDAITYSSGTTAAESVAVVHTYNPDGQLTSLARTMAPDPAGIGTSTTQWRYDAAGRRVAEVAPDGYVDSTAYDPAGNVVALVTRRGHTITMGYDALNRVTLRVLPDVAKLDTTVRSGTWPYPGYPPPPDTINWHFPLYGLPTFADTASFTYDAVGNLLTANNREARIRRTYSLNGTLQTDSLRIRTWAALSAGGDFTTHRYGLRHGYDLNGRRMFTLVPRQLGARFSASPTVVYDSMAYSYANFGALGAARDVLGNVFSYSYDLNGRLDRLGYPQGHFKQYTYNADDLPTTIRQDRTASSEGATETKSTYDARGRAIQVQPPGPAGAYGVQPYRYSGLGTLVGHDWVGPAQLQTRYDYESWGADALANVTSQYHSYEYQYPTSYGTHWVYGNLTETRTYAAGTGRQLASLTTAGGTDQNTGSGFPTGYSITIDGVPYLIPIDAGCWSSSWGHRLTRADAYDRAGNLTWAGAEWADSSKTCGMTSYFRTSDTTRTAYYYDAESRLRAVDRRTKGTGGGRLMDDPEVFEEHRYDALGRRVLRRARNTATGVDVIQRFVWDGAEPAAEVQYPGEDARTLAELERDTVTLNTAWSGRVLYLAGEVIDHPLSVVRVGYGNFEPWGITPHWGVAGQGYDHASYGPTPLCQTANGQSSCPSPGWPALQALWAGIGLAAATYPDQSYGAWFGSLMRDQVDATGLRYRRNRYYDPASGRFTQEDPIGLAGGLNLYRFAGGDPVNFSDPFGLCTPWPECWYQAAANWGASRAGVLGTVVLNMAAAGNGYAEAMGVNNLGRQIGERNVGGTALAVAGFLPIGRLGSSARLLRNVDGGVATASEALSAAERWLGKGYTEIANGVFRSANNARQFRMTASDLLDTKIGPHVHFEAIADDGKTVIQNAHVRIIQEP